MERRYRLTSEGWTLTKITERVAEIFGIEKDQVVVAGKQPDRVRARSVLACWAIRDLGLTATEIGKYLGLSKSAVSRAATRGQKLIVDQSLSLNDYKRVISTPSAFAPVNIAFNMGLQSAVFVLERAEKLSFRGRRYLLELLKKNIAESDLD